MKIRPIPTAPTRSRQDMAITRVPPTLTARLRSRLVMVETMILPIPTAQATRPLHLASAVTPTLIPMAPPIRLPATVKTLHLIPTALLRRALVMAITLPRPTPMVQETSPPQAMVKTQPHLIPTAPETTPPARATATTRLQAVMVGITRVRARIVLRAS